MEQQKIYVAKNYHDITLGSVDRISHVHSEPDGEGGLLFYIIGNTDAYNFCDKHGLLKREKAGQGPVAVAATEEDGHSGVSRTNSEYLRTGKLPLKYWCKDHEDVHAKGEPDYYSCVDKFQSGLWSVDQEQAAAEETIEESPGETPDPPIAEEAEGLPDPEEEAVPTIDLRTHSMNARDSLALIEELEDITALNMLKDGEGQHPDFKGGRKGILTAIHKRIQSFVE